MASAILKINAFDYVKDNLMLRINWNGKYDTDSGLIRKAILLNLRTLYPINTLKIKSVYILIFSVLGLAVILQAINLINKRNNWINYLLCIIGIIPYIRFSFLLNHSYNHYFFTFRAQLPTIIALLSIILINIKTLKMKNGDKNEKN